MGRCLRRETMKEECIITVYVDDVVDHVFKEKRTIYPGDKARQPMQRKPTHFKRDKQGRPILELRYYKARARSFSEVVDNMEKKMSKMRSRRETI